MWERNIAACFEFNNNIIINDKIHAIVLVELNVFPIHG